MDNQTRIYVEFAPELKARLNNRLSLQDILATAGIDADVEWHAVPSTDPEQRTKMLVETVACISMGTVSLAVAAKLIESLITHHLDHKAVRDSHFDYWEHESLLDVKGRPILDSKGKPRKIRRRVHGFDALPATSGEGVTIDVSAASLSASIGDNSERQQAESSENR